ncbi:MAG: D-alanyl-D-alanine carboxypeptidase [Desulfovibrionaceae bacterium]|nr:D-alanyl-D-alanine carboxypeptidase [Desulfovibrionaceae bacterium]
MRRLFFILTLCFTFIIGLRPSLYALNNEIPEEPQAKIAKEPFNVVSAILYDLNTNTVLYEQNADERIQPASLTKIMSMFLALDRISSGKIHLHTPVHVSEKAANEDGSRMGIRAGEEIRLSELLLGMAVSSGNDASYAVAEFIGGTNESFIQAMNAKAKRLGMKDTHFGTPNGLPVEGQYTTARDMLTLARAYLRRYPWALTMHNTRYLKHQDYVSWNKNPLLTQYPGADGLKTGWVRASGFNMIFTAERWNHRLLAVILGAPDALNRGIEACRMLDAGFLVCCKKEPSFLAALARLPYDNYKLDLYKSAHEARERYGYVSQGRGRRIRASRQGLQRAQKSRVQTKKRSAQRRRHNDRQT